ncbi:MAG TPA: ATP-dependent DNA ligase [Acidobacteriaceae bacterium]|jgi:DNA ligase-1|nr:ATP-dependent DNA ligase [Acidobacteriaceae bacterium]
MSSFLQFAELSDALAATTKKLEKRAFLAACLLTLPIEDAGRAALWFSGTPFPETDPRILNVGGSLLVKAIAQLSGATEHTMSPAYRRHGDLGAAAADLLYGHTPATATLTLADVESFLTALAEARGPQPKLRILLDLLGRATPDEAKYLIKLVTGDMRTGVQQSLVEEAIAEAWPFWLRGNSPDETPKAPAPAGQAASAAAVRRASMLLGNLGKVVALAAQGRLGEASMQLFHPIGFMLASPVQSIEEAIARVSQETKEAGSHEGWQLEDKYDGIRAQLHIDLTRRTLYSRNRDNLSAAFPDLIHAFSTIAEPAILDGEILAWNPGTRRALSFSSLQQRLGRKRVTPEMLHDIPAVLVVFDILYRGETLFLDEPLIRRRAPLEDFCARWSPATCTSPTHGQAQLFAEQPPAQQAFPRLILAPATRLSSPSASADSPQTAMAQALDRAYLDARARGNEGVMLKSLASTCQPGRRGLAWLKLKRELATLDVVVTGVEFGNGRRAQVLSDYTFAVRDPEDSAPDGGLSLKNVGKAYSGLTDREIADMTAFFKAHTLEDRGHFRTVKPTIVLEVAFNNVMRSSRHASGFALRFPRILRIRTDKPVAEIDTLQRVEEIYNSQPDKPVES